MYENEYFPCDLLLIGSSAPKGVCYVETKNLDGETNLKHKQAKKECWKLAESDKDVLVNFDNAVIECEKENEFIYKFFGTINLNKDDHLTSPIALDIDQILLRGSSLKNTKYVYGVALYTGHDSKVMMNSSNNKAKFSKIEKSTGKYIIMCICVQMIVCIISSIFNSIYQSMLKKRGEDHIYLSLASEDENVFVTFILNFGRWILAMMNFVPISLIVTLEMVKFFQGAFIEYDHQIYDEEKDLSAKA